MKLPSCCEQTQLRAYDSDGQNDSYDVAGFCLCEANLMRRKKRRALFIGFVVPVAVVSSRLTEYMPVCYWNACFGVGCYFERPCWF